jgi:hemerythrin superfamily protein
MTQHIHANDDETRHPPDDAIAMLTADHRRVCALFQQYADTFDPYLKQMIAEHVFAELTLHMLLEETVFYPAFAEQADEEGKRFVEEALPEHQEIKAFIETLQEIDDDTAFETRFQELRVQVSSISRRKRPECSPRRHRSWRPIGRKSRTCCRNSKSTSWPRSHLT